LKKNGVVVLVNSPNFIYSPRLSRNFLGERSIGKVVAITVGVVAKFLECPYINGVVYTQHRSNQAVSGDGEKIPAIPVKPEQAIVIGKIHKTLFILRNTPVLRACPVVSFSEMLHYRQSCGNYL